MPKEKPLPVIIRYEGKGKADRKDWHVRDLIAVFPTEAGDSLDWRVMAAFSVRDGHVTAGANYVGRRTKPATGTQIAAMMLELRAAGYKNLHLVSRASPAHARARREVLKK